MADEVQYCERLVREADKDRFLAALFAPSQHRPALFALYAFNVELARLRAAARQPMPGEIRLQWWRDVIGRQTADASPVAVALLAAIDRYRLPVQELLALVEARSFDLYDDPMASLAALEGYADKTSGAVMRLAVRILHREAAAQALSNAGHAGTADAIAALLTAFPVHAASRQLYLPLDVLQRYGGRPEDVFAGVATPALKATLSELAEVARGHLQQVAIAALHPAVMPALLPAALVRPTLDRLTGNDDPFSARPLPLWRRQWLLWRAARDPRRIV